MGRAIGRIGLSIIRLTVLLSLLLGMLPGAAFADGASVLAQPAAQSVAVDGTVTVTVRVEGVTDLYGAEVHLTFTPGVVQVVDADSDAGNGLQLATGDLFAGKNAFNALNTANNSTGTIDYAISLLGEPAGVTGAGNLFSVTFKGAAEGMSAVAFVTVMLASRAGGQIASTNVNGTITVTGGAQPTATNTTVPPTATTAAPTATTTTTAPTATATTVPATATATTVPGSSCTYTVLWGDTLYSIARRYNTTVSTLVAMNGLANPNYIRTGQKLYVPCAGGVTPVPPTVTVTPVPGCSGTMYTVVAGDTLYSIGRKYGVTVNAILAVNYIPNPNYIWVGQKICIPTGGTTPPTVTPVPGCRAQYKVVAGDTLLAIAARYGTTYWAIAMANNIANPNLIYPGTTLCIP